jgi:hypothetical protein
VTHRVHGRRQPYTAEGIKRLPCVRCGNPAHATWTVCADGNLHRPICLECDIAINEMVLAFVRLPGWRKKAANYRTVKEAARDG